MANGKNGHGNGQSAIPKKIIGKVATNKDAVAENKPNCSIVMRTDEPCFGRLVGTELPGHPQDIFSAVQRWNSAGVPFRIDCPETQGVLAKNHLPFSFHAGKAHHAG